MDPATIALTAAGLLATKALEAAAGKVGEGAWAALGRIADVVRRRFSGDPEVIDTLDRLEAKPTSEARTAEVAEVLGDRLQADPAFAEELARLIDQAKTVSPQAASFVTTVQDNAQVGKLTNIGQVTGDLHL